MSAELFQKIVTKDTVASFGTDMTQWSEADHSLFFECMVLSCKENPDWTEEEVKAECQEQVDSILQDKFLEEYGLLLFRIDSCASSESMYAQYKIRGRKGFHQYLGERLEFKEFCECFYDKLRERYNVSGSEMEEEYKRMKANKWDFNEYAKDLKKRR